MRIRAPRVVLAVFAAAACAAGCSSDTPIVRDVPLVRSVLPNPPFPQGWRVVDLTLPMDSRAPHLAHPREFPFERMELPPAEKGGPRTGGIALMEHMGTHLVAPRTREEGGASVERFGSAELLLPLVVLDPPAGGASETTLGVEQLKDEERLHGEIPHGAAVVLRTRAAGSAGAHPGFGGPAIRWLAKERTTKLVGIDAPECDTSAAPRGPAQSVAAGVAVWTLVNLRGLDALPRRGAFLVVGALPIVGAAGAPARVVALVPPDAPRTVVPAEK